jgi:hypothetical protein
MVTHACPHRHLLSLSSTGPWGAKRVKAVEVDLGIATEACDASPRGLTRLPYALLESHYHMASFDR